MAGQDIKQLNEQFYDEVFRNRNIDAIDTLLADDFVEHNPWPGQRDDRQGAKDFIGLMLTAFPDLDMKIESEVAEGDTVASLVTMSGTHQADFAGIPATGRKVSVTSMDFTKIRDGKCTDHWGLADMGTLMSQLGVGPQQ